LKPFVSIGSQTQVWVVTTESKMHKMCDVIEFTVKDGDRTFSRVETDGVNVLRGLGGIL